MLITTKHRSCLKFGGVTLTFLDLCPFTNRKLLDFFRFRSLTLLSQPNVMKLLNHAHYHKTQIKFVFWWGHFNYFRVRLQMEKLLKLSFHSLT